VPLFGHEQVLETTELDQPTNRFRGVPKLQVRARLAPSHRLPQDNGKAARIHELHARQIEHRRLVVRYLVERRLEIFRCGKVEIAGEMNERDSLDTPDEKRMTSV
jgi:hypothetical protein